MVEPDDRPVLLHDRNPNSLEAEFAVYEHRIEEIRALQDILTAYAELYLYSEDVGWIYEPTELLEGANDMAWIIWDLVPGDTVIEYDYYNQDEWLGSGDWESQQVTTR